MRQKRINIPQTILAAFLMLLTTQISAQIALEAPVPADNPNLSGTNTWPRACADSGFNEFFVTIEWAGAANSDNQFILELSNASGSFATPLELSTVTDQNSNTEFTTSFSLPTDTRGANYKMRIRSTSPASTSPESAGYSMYYLGFDTNLHMSPNGDGTTPGSVQACGGTQITLSVDNVPAGELNTYQYSWYRSGTLLSETGPTILTDGAGEYFVFIDYGDCTGSANTESNHIIVNSGTSTGIAINPPATTSVCAGDTVAPLEANVQDGSYIYTWYKDGTEVQASQAGGFTYTIDTNDPSFTGDYTVEVRGTGICTETSAAVAMNNAGAFTVTRNNNANLVVLPSQTQTLNVTTDANAPTYEWFRNGTPIPSSNNASLTVSQAGTYHAAITQTGGTCSSTTINSENTEVVAPTAFRTEIAYATSYESCSSTSIALTTDKIYAVLADGSEVDVTADVASSFTYQWQKDGIDIASETSQSISLTDSNENGNYTVETDLGGMNATSNTLGVQLASEALTISSTSTVYCSSSDVITLSTTTDLSSETFDWERNGEAINSSDASLSITQEGTYRLVVRKGSCSQISNEINITPLDPDLITLDIDGDVIFPEGSSKTVNASGGTAYRWLDANNIEISGSSSATFTTEGNYLLIANIDNCEISKPITVTYLDLFNIPNVITPNGDGANDQWIIPNSYSNKSDVRVIIYNAKGVEVLNSTNYQNNWPESSMSFAKQNMVFYYVIKNASETLKQGTVTVIR
ncbi:gliding motility-associated C-terminal domain-containing protein [Zobellia sp. 1_MG-2023]|uniref:T9SS type B sorting domain-containing protein n=1 Tax=Zobellia sp. 1_MG-2023 TaxID=3062626 RepID=UPI0026E48D08|nr:gliding motility-associated C-terminal domain-containing protein [Zobellia sp. 1_MG-2023]MDO6818136.1 gliding motility-associated C-terminal domain-containing protein [Zobellia sp. 1_MG-2023]